MTSASSCDVYIHRAVETDVLDALDVVRSSGVSQAVLLYGPGGVGKTRMVRNLAKREEAPENRIVWVLPIDVDDSEYWLLDNFQRDVANRLDPTRSHFAPYFDAVALLPRYSSELVGHETVNSHFWRARETFVECYRTFMRDTGTTAVITLDTVEAVRSMYLLLYLTQWMTSLPRTLFILSGRPPSPQQDRDPIREQLEGSHSPTTTVEITMPGFTEDEAIRFLDAGPLDGALTDVEKRRLVVLADGHPLWLALAVNFLVHNDPPPEMRSNTAIDRNLRESFRRTLVTPYRDTGFWSEAIKRLAVVRHSVNRHVWNHLMSDRDLPADVADSNQAWELLLGQPWVRPRANKRYITLHDALAEELAQRLIPLDDQDESWRVGLWRRALSAYETLTEGVDERVQSQQELLSKGLRAFDDTRDESLADWMAEVYSEKRELDQMKTAELHYRLLVDFQEGTTAFLHLYGLATKRHDTLFQELICHEVERFLPRAQLATPLEDVLGVVVRRFHRWLVEDASRRYLEIALDIANFLTGNQQPAAALELLRDVPVHQAGPELRFRLANARGNACMRIPNQVDKASTFFHQAGLEARGLGLSNSKRLQAQAHKELGYYLRNIGKWVDADAAYLKARNTISKLLGPGSSDLVREEMASIQTNWAYLKALQGNYEEARNLVESAILVRTKIGDPCRIGISLSVSGEVDRYDRNFRHSWKAYGEAESIFKELGNWSWLGLIYQEQAICLFQAQQEGIDLVDKPLDRARELIQRALDICRELAIRSYPSALNRAGRICGADDVDVGLDYLDQSIDEARRIADGWFLSANLIEYMELSYRAWLEHEDDTYRRKLDARADDVREAIDTYDFRDLCGRWNLMQGHLVARDALATQDWSRLDRAVQHYAKGFAELADQRVGSHGASAIAREFRSFQDVYDELPEEYQTNWYAKLRSEWSASGGEDRFTSLLARLEQLY
ncbi:MAG TPA: AAA family ATPase [Umezawaea sp.]|nr:AAA family ATPase [Umezawaea sp.]